MEAKDAINKIKVLLGLEDKQDDNANNQNQNDNSGNDNSNDSNDNQNDDNANTDEFKFTKDQYDSIVSDITSVKESYSSMEQRFSEQGQQLESLKESSKLILEQFEKLLGAQKKDSTDTTPTGFSAHKKSSREGLFKEVQDALNSQKK